MEWLLCEKIFKVCVGIKNTFDDKHKRQLSVKLLYWSLMRQFEKKVLVATFLIAVIVVFTDSVMVDILIAESEEQM